MKKLAEVYERNDDWYFQPSSQATTGLWIATPPVIRLKKQDSSQRKWEAVMEVLNASRQGVPVPADNENLVAPLLALAKVKSWAAFMKNGKCIGLELENGCLTIMPHRKFPRPKGALEGISEQAIVLSADASPEAIGSALEEAMSRCK
jgi:hypothetical protein